jgi:putative ABC transport system ATP-binding protein
MNRAEPAPPGLRVRSLTKQYLARPVAVSAIGGVDLDIPAGQVTLIMGPSGSGKTTLLLMLGALLRPTSGSIRVTDPAGATIDVAAARERDLPRLRAGTFGFVFQDYALIPALTAAENVAIACNLAGVRGRAARERVGVLLGRVGLLDRARFRPSQLSGGEQQRVAVARALANDPPVLLADEPTANLDAAHGQDLARLLRDLATRDGRAVAVVSHDNRLREIADQTHWLEDGRLREMASMARDPVCGMLVERSGPPLVEDGRTYWFCALGCRDEFLAMSSNAEPASRDGG